MLPSLFRLNAALRPEPDLVARWPTAREIRFDPFSVTVRLRRASWSDGRTISPEDVRFSFEKLRDGPTGYRYRFLRAIDVVGARMLTLRFDRPVRRWWALFSLDDMVLPAHAYSPEWAKGPTVSGGPFAFREWTEGLSVKLVRNDAYWGPKAVLAGIEVLFVEDDETQFQLLQRDELHAFFAEGDVNIGRRASARGIERVSGALNGAGGASGAWGPSWWELDLDPGRLGEEIAQATVHATDSDIFAEILEDSGAPMDGIPPVFPVARGPIDGVWADRGNIEQARQLLGSRKGSFELAFSRGSVGGSFATVIHFTLRKLGVSVELVGLESDAFELSLDDKDRPPAVVRLRRGSDAADAPAYSSFSGEPGAGPVDDHVEAAEATDRRTLRRSRALPGLTLAPWEAAQDGLQRSATTAPLARVRTWIVGRPGVVGPQAQGAITGPLWNAGTWRFTASR